MKTVCHSCQSPLEGATFIGAQDDVDDDGRPQYLLLINCPSCGTTLSLATVRIKPYRPTLGDVFTSGRIAAATLTTGEADAD